MDTGNASEHVAESILTVANRYSGDVGVGQRMKSIFVKSGCKILGKTS